MKKTNILQASFIILKIWKLLMQKLKQASPKEAIDDFMSFIKQQKSANTNKKMATDMNTLLRYMEANDKKWENWKLTCVQAWPPFVESFFERMAQEKWRRVPANNSFQFSAQYTAIV